MTGIAPYTAGMARGLSEAYDVQVVTAHPHYPAWKVSEGHGGWRRSGLEDGVALERLKHLVPSQPTGISRILSEATFAARALAPGVKRPDAVVVVSPALLPVASALALGRRWRVPVGVVVQDLYGKAFGELGLLGGRLDRPVQALESNLLRRADGVVAIHQRMADAIVRDLGIAADDVTVIPNWAHVQAPDGDRQRRRRELGWDDGRFVVTHAGNMGAKQGLDHLVTAAKRASDIGAPVRFVMIGSGGARAALEQSARGVSTIEFMDQLPGDQFMATLAASDALLLHERPGMKEMCVPSKLTTYFAAGRPVIAATDGGSAGAFEVGASGAGVVAEPGAPEALLAALDRLRLEDLDRLGAYGFEYARNQLSEQVALDRYRAWVEALLSSGNRCPTTPAVSEP
ncbi:glycosyltransferase [Nocardioides sp. 31GB23]|uniref:glycosyltransferase n=1 Tax=Nocardioides sp. 31GB23 TaxID=3156065 RepID=UPI0032AFEF84